MLLQLQNVRTVRQHKGFTLLEVMIAMTLFSVMALFLMRITDSGVRYQKIVTKNVKNIRSIRSVWQVLRQDIYNVFLVKNKHVLLNNNLNRLSVLTTNNKDLEANNNTTTGDPSSRNPISNSLPNAKQNLVGQFKGTNNQLYFTSLSDKHVSFQSLVGDSYLVFYYLKSCKNSHKDKKCLWRKSFSDITTNPEQDNNGTEFILLENVKTIQLSYFNILDNEWKTQWPTVRQSGHLLPVAVKMILEFQNKKKHIITEQMIVPVHRNYISLRMLR